MSSIFKNNQGSTKITIAIYLVVLSVVAVTAVPRYNRIYKADRAKAAILHLKEASAAVVLELEMQRQQEPDNYRLPTDRQALKLLEKHLGGTVPMNPFTQSRNIALRRHPHFIPCDCLDVTGGWLWKLVVPENKDQKILSQFWPNSDTVNIGNGKGESCLQP